MAPSDPKPVDFARPIDRRVFLIAAGASATSACLPFAGVEADASDGLLRRAQEYAGRPDVLERVRLLAWEGDAAVHADGRQVTLGISTMVAPFFSARSTSWPLALGRSASRTMIIKETGGWVEHEGGREPLPPYMVAHERAQFAIYGLMLLQFDRGRAELRRVAYLRGLSGLRVDHPKAPVTRLFFESDGRLAEAVNTAPHPVTGRPVRQRFIFSAEQMPGPVRWPRTIRIEQEGKPYFELRLARFEAVT